LAQGPVPKIAVPNPAVAPHATDPNITQANIGQPSVPISPSEANAHRGETVTVCGHPSGYMCSVVGTAFTFLGANGSMFRVFIPRMSRRRFGPGLEEQFSQRNVCTTGEVDPFGPYSQIVVTSPEKFVLGPEQGPPVSVFGPTAYRTDCDPDVIAPKLK